MSENGIDATVEALRSLMGRSVRRMEAVASNIANLETPGYRAKDRLFDDTFAGEMKRTAGGHRAPLDRSRTRGVLVDRPVTSMSPDGNTVDIDAEMTLSALLQGRYRTSAELLRKRFALLIYTANDGRA